MDCVGKIPQRVGDSTTFKRVRLAVATPSCSHTTFIEKEFVFFFKGSSHLVDSTLSPGPGSFELCPVHK